MFFKCLKSLPILIGAYTLTSHSYINLRDAYNNFYRIPINLQKTYNDQGYFLITGASDNLGKAFSRELAVKGIPLILISKHEDSLQKLKSELEKEFSSKIEIITFDFERASIESYESLFAQINQFEISGLINNTGSFLTQDFEKTTFEDLIKTIKSNILPNVFFSKYALERFKKKPPSSKSLISTISSALGAYPHPHISIFSASQAWNSNLMRSLIMEKPTNVDLNLIEPGLYSNQGLLHDFPSEWKESFRWKWLISETDEVAEEIVRRLGQEKVIYGTFRHWVYHCILRNCEKMVNYLNEGTFLNL